MLAALILMEQHKSCAFSYFAINNFRLKMNEIIIHRVILQQ